MPAFVHGIFIVAFSLLFSGCSVNPVTGEREFSLVSPAQEVAIGQQNFAPYQQAQGGRYYVDPDLQVYVAEIGNKLAAVSDRPNLPYEFVVLNNNVPNAWALPGGKIAINRGLLLQMQDESELAAVLAHEIVHAAAKHGAQQMTRGTLIGTGAQVLGVLSNNSQYGSLANMGMQLGTSVFMAQYSQAAEREADAYGVDYMVRAGYDPMGAVRLQEAFVDLNKDRSNDFLSNLFATHPPSLERAKANRERAQGKPNGIVNRDRYQRAIAQIRQDVPAYEAQDKAIKALQEENPAAALRYLDQATKIQPEEGYFWELRGHAWKMQENYSNAEKAFSTAIRKNPELYSHYLARGLLRFEQGSRLEARADLERSQALLPTQAASFLLGELASQENQSDIALEYYQSAMQGGGDIAKQAQSRMVRIELPRAPHKYIAAQTFVGQDGYLRVAVKNNTGLTVNQIDLEIAELSGSFTVVRSARISGPETLGGGQQRIMTTGIGPFKSADAAQRYRAKAVSAAL